MNYRSRCGSPLGEILLMADEQGLTGLWFADGRYAAQWQSVEAAEEDSPHIDAAKRWLAVYFSGREPDFTPALHLTGTDFRCRVGRLLLEIPYGHTVTYGALARRLARERGSDRSSSRAVGGAVARNPISLIVPCHRVVGSDGSLTGYAGGLWRKEALLRLEGGDALRR